MEGERPTIHSLAQRIQFTDNISRVLSPGCLGLKTLALGNSQLHTEQSYFTTSWHFQTFQLSVRVFAELQMLLFTNIDMLESISCYQMCIIPSSLQKFSAQNFERIMLKLSIHFLHVILPNRVIEYYVLNFKFPDRKLYYRKLHIIGKKKRAMIAS